MDNPDGTGALTISRMMIEADSVSFDFEGKVEGYGTVFATHTFSYIGEDRSRAGFRERPEHSWRTAGS